MQSTRVSYRWTLVSALRNKTQNATVISTSATAVNGVNEGSDINLPEIAVPPIMFTTIESAWLVTRKSK